MTLTEFLLARIAEDEHMANVTAEAGGVRIPFNLVPLGCFDPARVLAECEAKRRIVGDENSGAALFAVHERGLWPDELTRWADEVLRLLALPYADHPDYRDEWKP